MNEREYAQYQHRRKMLLKKKKEKEMRKRLIILQTIVFIILASAIFLLVFVPGNDSLVGLNIVHPETLSAESDLPTSNKIDYSFMIKEINEEINSKNAILLELSSGEVMAEKKPDEKIYPASITKVLTAIIALEHFENTEEELEVPSHIFGYLREQNASVAGFYAGEKVKVIDLLYGVLLPSGADACLTLATTISANEQEFAKLMTQKAHELGALNTNFVNSTGLHDDNHYTTVRDLSKILSYALKNETFRKIFTTEKYTTSKTNMHSKGITLNNTTFSALSRAGITSDKVEVYVKGGKTGFTGEACLCLASLGQKNGKEFILITVGAGSSYSNRGVYHVVDAQYVYENYANIP